MDKIRIGCGQGFWGDSLEAPVQLVTGGPLNYLILDYLAEVTMSILTRQKQKNPQAGYARDFVSLVERIAPELVKRKIKVIANAGGVNPQACGQAVLAVLEKLGLKGKLRVGLVVGDNLFETIDDSLARGEKFLNLDDGRDFSQIRNRLQSANVYLGGSPIAQALGEGADLVITGRVADPSLALGPMIYEFGWEMTDWDRLAAGTVAGHIIECGAQCSGGNCSLDWETIPDLAHVGYPIVEIEKNGRFIVTKHEGTGGTVSLGSVKEQLVYEIGDPKAYMTPDVIADFTSLRLRELEKNKIEILDVKGYPRPEKLKVSMSYSNGYMASGSLVYCWPDAYKKAIAASKIIEKRVSELRLKYETMHFEAIGVDACFDKVSLTDVEEIPEVTFRAAIRGQDRSSIERFTREIVPLVLNGPPSATAYFAAKGSVQDVNAYWPTLINRENVFARVEIL